MPLLEIITGAHTDDTALATASAMGKNLKKTCILVKDSPSFIVNRLLGRFMAEAGKVVDEGTPDRDLDAAFAGSPRMPPSVPLGLVGPAVALHNARAGAGLPDRFYVPEGIKRIVEAGRTSFYTLTATGMAVDPAVVEPRRDPGAPDPVERRAGP